MANHLSLVKNILFKRIVSLLLMSNFAVLRIYNGDGQINLEKFEKIYIDKSIFRSTDCTPKFKDRVYKLKHSARKCLLKNASNQNCTSEVIDVETKIFNQCILVLHKS